MKFLEIILLIAGTVTILYATTPAQSDCLQEEQACLQDVQCNSSYHIFQDCSSGEMSSSRCQNAALVLQESPLLGCKCQHRMRREEHCLNVYWTVHPVQDDLVFDESPYEESEFENMLTSEYSRVIEDDPSLLSMDTDNVCLQQANICSSNNKCSRHKTSYASLCNQRNADGSCDRRKCHRHLRNFFDKVSEEFTKRLLFCPCEESYCAERRRRTIVPECSFEEKSKKNCLQLQHSCVADIVCRSHLADFQKNCFLSDKTSKECPPEKYGACLQSYIRMIGTVMTPNYINNSSMDVSLWCTCDGSGNQREDCNTVLGMFANNRCFKNAIAAEINRYTQPQPEVIPQPSTVVISAPVKATDQDNFEVDGSTKVLIPNINDGADKASYGKSNTASGVSCPSLALTLPILLWLSNVFYML
ncbi:hypothetical protein XENTR_v10008376 [Xenopus tropicalis]|uniref:GDNF family receptor alpha-3 n=1 Tax=Xenopus tropicalis TaxID=8364 RepID=F7B6N4_XENTR|nr:GDNF family receptor alpha-3 [Xenopus tropicalis]KAE8615002.1 hypothetical protein XENTR_v10008376 [Xenopus tropicalis]|eukprot:XP_002936895.1 PREDICTED: GDNF family receptor alpha-3 [Xenopus tropicalis]